MLPGRRRWGLKTPSSECRQSGLITMVPFVCQDALCAELNNLGTTYGKEVLEKPPVTSNEQKNHTVDQEQFLR